MFTGIIEELGEVKAIANEGSNIHFTIASKISKELKIDQSVAHNGVCLTITSQTENAYTVTAIAETLQKTNLKDWKVGQIVNLERAMLMGARLDGHIVQGHVDSVGTCIEIVTKEGSTEFTFRYPIMYRNLVIEKGSICINGVSLTAFDCVKDTVKVAIIPYTFEHTNIKHINIGDTVNIEYDIIGKYISRQQEII